MSQAIAEQVSEVVEQAPSSDVADAEVSTTPEPATDKAPEPSLWSKAPVDGATDEATPEVEEVPEWFMKDKYKSIEDQARAQFDMQKLMGKNWGPPKEDYTTDNIEGIAKNDPLLEHLKPSLKELGLSQEGFNSLVKKYQEANLEMSKKLEAELAKELTTNDAMTVRTVDSWLNNSFSKEDRETIQSWIVSVKDFQLLNTLRTMLPQSTNVPSSSTGAAVHFESMKEVENDKIKYRKEVNSKQRTSDKNYEDQLQQRWRDAYTRENRGRN